MTKITQHNSSLVCNLTAFDEAQRKRHELLVQQLRASTQAIQELSNGYAFCLPSEASLCLAAAEFITLERLCCPFLAFALEVEPEAGPLWLKLTGPDGVKQFLRAELGLDD